MSPVVNCAMAQPGINFRDSRGVHDGEFGRMYLCRGIWVLWSEWRVLLLQWSGYFLGDC